MPRAPRRRIVTLVLLAVFFVCQGCARYVLLEPNAGVVAIPANLPSYRKQAHKLMLERFPEGYVIDREEEVWRKEDLREWHIFFHGKDRAEGAPLPSQVEHSFLPAEAVLFMGLPFAAILPVSFALSYTSSSR